MRRRYLAFGLLLCVAFGAVRYVVMRSEESRAGGQDGAGGQDRAERAAPAGQAGGGGVQPRPFDPASQRFKGGWAVADGRGFADLADGSQDITLMAIERPGKGLEELERWMRGQTDEQLMLRSHQCSQMHLPGLTETCDFRLRMVVRRSDEETGKVVFVAPTSEAALGEQCRAYGDCLANSAFLGESVPFPAGLGDALAMHQDHRMVPFKGSGAEYRAELDAELKTLQAELEVLMSNPDADPRQIEELEYLIQFVALRKDAKG